MSEREDYPDTRDYRDAPSGHGPLAAQWKDKPHRLVYDLCREVDRLRRAMAEARVREREACARVVEETGLGGPNAHVALSSADLIRARGEAEGEGR